MLTHFRWGFSREHDPGLTGPDIDTGRQSLPKSLSNKLETVS